VLRDGVQGEEENDLKMLDPGLSVLGVEGQATFVGVGKGLRNGDARLSSLLQSE